MASLAEQFLDDVGSSDSSDTDSAPQQVRPNADELQQVDSNAPEHSLPTTYIEHTFSQTLSSLHQRIKQSESTSTTNDHDGQTSKSDYALVADCAAAISDIDELIISLHHHLLSAHNPRFPELETLILNPMDYARVAALSLDHSDLSTLDLRSILPSATTITVQVTASSTTGRPLSPSERKRVVTLTTDMNTLDTTRATLLEHVAHRAQSAAPNLCAVVDAHVAAALLATAGGLKPLSVIPASNLQTMGRTRRALHGASSTTLRLHDGLVFTTPIVMALAPRWRARAGRVVAGKASLAARVDAQRTACDGSMGRRWREELDAKFAKMVQPPPAKTAKPLPVPGDEAKRKHRGGKRARREKERLGLTDVRRLANRVKFGQAETVRGNDLENDGLGMLGAKDSQRLRIAPKKSDTVSKAARRKLEKLKKKEGQSEAERLGITSRFVLTAPDEFELGAGTGNGSNVASSSADAQEEKSMYFSAATPFVGEQEVIQPASKKARVMKE